MSGAATVAYADEDSYLGSVVTDPTYYQPGKDVTVQDLELSNALQRVRDPSAAEAALSVATRLEGAVAVAFTMTNVEWHTLVTNDGSDSSLTPGQMPSTRWFVGVDYASGTVERELKGVVPLEWSLEYTEGGLITVTLTMAYGDESKNTSITPGTVSKGGDPFVFHGAALDIDGVAQTKMSSATLSMSNISRLQRGAQRKPVDAVVAAPEASLNAQTAFTEADQLEVAYGNASAPATGDISSVSGSLTVDNGTTTATYNLSNVKPDTYSWADVVNKDADFAESIAYHVNGVSIA